MQRNHETRDYTIIIEFANDVTVILRLVNVSSKVRKVTF